MSQLSPTQTDAWPAPLLDLLEHQHAIVTDLARLAETQAAHIAGSSAEALLDVLARRQALIDQFTASQRDLTVLTHDLDRRLSTVHPSQRDRIRDLIGQIGDQLTQVMRRDEQDQSALRNSRDQVKQELTSIGVTRQARSAYFGAGANNNRLADRHG